MRPENCKNGEKDNKNPLTFEFRAYIIVKRVKISALFKGGKNCKKCIGKRRKVTAKNGFKSPLQIICADKCGGATPATNRGLTD